MKLTDEELEFLDKFINEANINEEVFEVFTDKLLDSVICDAKEVEFEEFTNNLSVFAIRCKEYEQEWIANHVTELFTDKFFVYTVKKYAEVKEQARFFITTQYKNKSCIEETAGNWFKTSSEIYEQLISDYLFISDRV